MHISIDASSGVPIYQQMVESIMRAIRTGELPANYQLPTVRQLADQCGASQGTVKHAYDTLEQLGLIEKTQGRGTFVCDMSADKPSGKKEQALEAIDRLLDRMQELDFPLRDIRIFLDLKLREREQMFRNVRIGAVDCSPEALSVMCRQVSELPHVDVYEYPLQQVLEDPQRFNPGLDLIVTTPTHYHQLNEKMLPDVEPVRLVMAIASPTVLALARIPADARVGIVCASERFSSVILRAIGQFCGLRDEPRIAYFGDTSAIGALLDSIDQLILPSHYLRFCSGKEQSMLSAFAGRVPPIEYHYQVERGSLLYLEEQADRIYQNNRTKL